MPQNCLNIEEPVMRKPERDRVACPDNGGMRLAPQASTERSHLFVEDF
jgi:hypothetical protein